MSKLFQKTDLLSIPFARREIKRLSMLGLVAVLLSGTATSSYAQVKENEKETVGGGKSAPSKITIKGTVVDDMDMPLPGAHVKVRGMPMTASSVTDVNGQFILSLPEGNHVLEFSYVGMKPISIRATANKPMRIRMEPDAIALKETVVNGIYTRNIESFTGSISTFTNEDLKQIGAQNILRSLSVLDPSFIITENNLQGSNPNAQLDININGKMNITALEQEYETNPNQPLFILDGFETTLQTISDLNMDRVESISILKDASSTAIYGSKAANGVVVVETKKPQAGKLRVSYNGNLQISWADLSDYNLMNSAEKLEFERLAGVYGTLDENGEITEEWYRTNYNDKLKLVREGLDTYWLNEPLRTAYSHNHNLYVDGGDSAFRYGVGLSYNKTAGVMKKSDRDVFNGNITLSYRVDRISFTNQTTIGNTTSANEPVPFSSFSRMNPFYEKYTENGEVAKYVYREQAAGSNNYSYIWNPLWDFQQNSFNESEGNNITNNFQMEWRMLNELRLRGNFQYSLSKTESERFTSPNATSEVNKETLKKGSYSNSNTNNSSYNGRLDVTYGKSFKEHTINAAAGIQFSENNSKSNMFSVEGYQTDQFSNPNFSNGYPEGSRPMSTNTKSRNVSYYANVNYAYAMRYLMDFNFSSNGASQFGINDPFTNTWSIGVGWNLHNENFLKDSDIINYLKLRYSYGNPGNQNFDAKLSSSIYRYITDLVNPFGLAAKIGTWGNSGLKWQKTQTHNIGVNGQLFNNRLNFTVDYQTRRNDPLLMRIDLPASVGSASAPRNIGATKNYSISASLTWYILKQQDLNWYVSANINHNKSTYYNIGNLMEEFNKKGEENLSLSRIYDGASLSSLWVVRSAGIDPATGNEIFLRKDGTYTYEYSIKDAVEYADTNPDMQGSFNTSFTYKGFSFGAAFTYRIGGYTQLNALLSKVENINDNALKYNQDRRALHDRWKQPGDRTKFKRIDDTSNTPMSSRFVEKENTLQCSSINVGYRTTTAPFLKYIGATSLNVTAYMNDIFRLSTIKEERGLDYPFQRSVTLSFGIGF